MIMQFIKYHGLGNDFIFIKDFDAQLVLQGQSLAKALCHRQFGIGADGLVFVTKETDLYTMRIFNADGTEAEMCGNAVRCMADYLLKQGLVTGSDLKIGTKNGVREVLISGGLYVVDMGEADFSLLGGEMVEVVIDDKTWNIYPVSVGNPHGVIFVDDLVSLDFEAWGARLSTDSIWPNGANIEFTEVLTKNHLKVKVWERGAGPTLACGTGASAAAVVASKFGFTNELKGGAIRVSLPGGDLSIHGSLDQHIHMAGPATEVFTGSIDISKIERAKIL